MLVCNVMTCLSPLYQHSSTEIVNILVVGSRCEIVSNFRSSRVKSADTSTEMIGTNKDQIL